MDEACRNASGLVMKMMNRVLSIAAILTVVVVLCPAAQAGGPRIGIGIGIGVPAYRPYPYYYGKLGASLWIFAAGARYMCRPAAS
jgi:hypothetical protein